MKNCVYYDSSIGLILIEEENGVVTKLDFVKSKSVKKNLYKSKILDQALKQLDQYFKKRGRNFL